MLRPTSATVQSASMEDAARAVKLARPGLVFFTFLGGLWLLGCVLVTVASSMRMVRGGADLSQSEAIMSLVGALGTLAAPVVLWIRHVAREIWPSTPRAIETQQRLRRTVLYSAAASGIAALVAQLFEVVVWRTGSGLARPGWALFVIGVAVSFAVATWFALAPRRPKS
jgi:hypothetical protein